MTAAVIQTKGLTKTYRMGKISVEALKATDITIQPGEYIAIMGPSGSGKSTLMNLIGCLDVPSEGSLFIDGIDVSTLSENDLARIRREKIGFIFQKYNLIPTLTAMENVMLSMSFAGVNTPERIKRAKKFLNLVDLGHRLDHKPSELSGGEQQRVAIARSLSNQPSLILADEPTGNVDTKAGNKIMEVLEEINHQGKTIITVTHDPNIAQRAHRILHIQDGIVSENHV
ncbi:MAG: ABC transporter ATP-binding protein [Candidatus Thermoplasmatota archaeon]|nr:ABC transporter ATP-binding protein [Candidatus Thermoplasmatota archaeon]MBU1940928.1 ABC transporter ATP-binding protein [Candidatus Thermoplasmatota archaeon]